MNLVYLYSYSNLFILYISASFHKQEQAQALDLRGKLGPVLAPVSFLIIKAGEHIDSVVISSTVLGVSKSTPPRNCVFHQKT